MHRGKQQRHLIGLPKVLIGVGSLRYIRSIYGGLLSLFSSVKEAPSSLGEGADDGAGRADRIQGPPSAEKIHTNEMEKEGT